MTEPSKVTPEEVNTFLAQGFAGSDGMPEVMRLEQDQALVRMACGPAQLRPGNLISGPTQMALADTAAYAAVFTRTGITPMAVTTNLSINFLRPCKGQWLEAEAKTLKFGRTGIVVEVNMRGDALDKLASQAIVTYVLPKE